MGQLSTACLAAHTHLIQSLLIAWTQAVQAYTNTPFIPIPTLVHS